MRKSIILIVGSHTNVLVAYLVYIKKKFSLFKMKRKINDINTELGDKHIDKNDINLMFTI